MIQKVLVSILLSPISLLYGTLVSIRNFFFSVGLVRRSSFNLPVINIGNLSIGGTGKTPHVEYLIRLLKPYLDIAVLSRGYGRNSRGFLFVDYRGDARRFGDEPLQFKRKFPDLVVAVSESRALGIPEIVKAQPNTQTIILDDAFQHLSVAPSLNILLTEHGKLFTDDYLLPSGRLREWRSAYERADVIVVTKCRTGFDEKERLRIIEKIRPLNHQKIFFSHYQYGQPYAMYGGEKRALNDETLEVLLVSAIAHTDYLEEYLIGTGSSIHFVQFEDHHYFSEHELSQIKLQFDAIDNPNKFIICSEKDAMRLDLHRDYILKEKLPIFALPIRVAFLFEEGPVFDELIKKHLLNFKI